MMYMQVVLIAVFALVSGQSNSLCERPQDDVMTCIENMPRIDTRARPDGYGPPTSGGEAPPQGGEPPPPGGDRQARQAVVEKQPTMLKLGTPPISGEIVDYICSSAGDELVNCTSKVYEQCELHPGLRSVAYNPAATESVKMKCNDQHQKFKDSFDCMKTSSKSKPLQDCYDKIEKDIQEKDIPPKMIICSIPGSVYNCMWTYMGSDCGRSTVAFYISTLRIREEPSCTKVINQQYKETISAGTKTITSELLLFVSVPFLFV